MKRNTEKITFTPHKWASLIGCDRHELAKKLNELGCTPATSDGRGNEYSVRDLFNAAVGGDIAEQRLRKIRAEADHLEMSLQVKRRELVPISESVETVVACAWDIRAAILALPLEPAAQDAMLLQLQKVAEIWQARADALAGNKSKD